MNLATGFAAPRAAGRAFAFPLVQADTDTRRLALMFAASTTRISVDISEIRKVWSDVESMRPIAAVIGSIPSQKRGQPTGTALSQFPIDEARRVPIRRVLDLLGVSHRAKGNARRVRVPCPVHGGADRNCSVDLTKNVFHCFVCGAGGDGIEMMLRTRGLDFPAAVQAVLS